MSSVRTSVAAAGFFVIGLAQVADAQLVLCRRGDRFVVARGQCRPGQTAIDP